MKSAEQQAHAPSSGWESFYALGWYDVDGTPYLSSWMGDRPIVRMLSVDCNPTQIPMWQAGVPDGAKLILVPTAKEELYTLMKTRQARIVIGWVLPEAIKREAP